MLLSFPSQLMISGLGNIDIEDWKAHTRLKHCSQETNIVKWFWRLVSEFDEEQRARLLHVCDRKLTCSTAGLQGIAR